MIFFFGRSTIVSSYLFSLLSALNSFNNFPFLKIKFPFEPEEWGNTIRIRLSSSIKFSGLNIEPIFGPSLKGDVMKTVADITLIKEKIGWEPKMMLVEWIKEITSLKKFNEV